MEAEVLLIDNYDSFTFNLAHGLRLAGARLRVLLNDDPELIRNAEMAQILVISPGPSRPENAGFCKELMRKFVDKKPILGVCLGMQIINEAFGGATIPAPEVVHGKISRITVTDPIPLFTGLPRRLQVARYHSLICKVRSKELKITARVHGMPMAFQHVRLPVFGVQFHPESFLTPMGLKIIQNFLAAAHEYGNI